MDRSGLCWFGSTFWTELAVQVQGTGPNYWVPSLSHCTGINRKFRAINFSFKESSVINLCQIWQPAPANVFWCHLQILGWQSKQTSTFEQTSPGIRIHGSGLRFLDWTDSPGPWFLDRARIGPVMSSKLSHVAGKPSRTMVQKEETDGEKNPPAWEDQTSGQNSKHSQLRGIARY